MNMKPFLWNFCGRRSARMTGYDYSEPGWYFVTICAQNRRCLLGEIINDVMELNRLGSMVADEWMKSATIRQEISLGPWVIMPNHLHMLILIRGFDDLHFTTVGAHGVRPDSYDYEPIAMSPSTEDNGHARGGESNELFLAENVRGGRRPPLRMQPRSLGSLMSAFKSATTSRNRDEFEGYPTKSMWQRNYWEHVIRSDKDYEEVVDYIINNPKNWGADELNPKTL